MHTKILFDSNCEVQNICNKSLKELHQVWDQYISLKFSTLFWIDQMHFQSTLSMQFQHNIGIPTYKRGLTDKPQ